MSKLITRSLTAIGQSAPVLVNYLVVPVNLGLVVLLTGGTATYSVEATLADPDDYATQAAYNAAAVWFAVTGMSALSANAMSSQLFPVRAVRLNVAACSGATVVLTVLQAGIAQ